ncbi:MAG: hypothetical protein ACRECX_10440 [Methyloceanibacter sp.]|uniref:hypothetical protein n=1 Tax=Methyloceanibacter sp. TaxID=1965321 RepID=UPI003D6CEAB5
MQRSSFVVVAALAGTAAFAQPAAAQDFTTATYGGSRIWAGGGVQFLSLPDIRFVGKGSTPATARRQRNSESDWLDFGGAAGGGIETALGWWGNHRVSGSVKGFWANLEDDDTSACRNQTCFVFDPTGVDIVFGPPTLQTRTSRDADYWGAQAELKFATGAPQEVKPNVYRNDYWIAGFDVRGIDQSNRLRGRFNGAQIYNYNETLDTTYYGGYVGFGGEYSFGFVPIIGSALKGSGGLFDRLGLRTYINATAGLYSADTDYNGRYFTPVGGGFSSALSQSNDELAFIGTISLETRKQIGTRTSLSLWTDYEYISSVPEMRYANTQRPTRIDDDSVFATRTMLRLNIGLGSQQLYPPPP